MKNIGICLIALAATALIGFCFYSYSPTGIDEAEVLNAMSRLHHAEQSKDIEKLNQIFADEISWSHNREQKTYTKKQIVDFVAKANFHIESIKAFFVSTKIEENKAQVFFTMIVTFIDEDGKPFDHTGDYVYTFKKRQSEWKLTATHLEN